MIPQHNYLMKLHEEHKERHIKWRSRFLNMAKEVSTWSKDPNSQVGAVIYRDNKLVSVGYNGFPKKIKDDSRLLDRPLKNRIIRHAEINAILETDLHLDGCILVTYPFPPCERCASVIIDTGISLIVAPNNIPDKWSESMNLALELFKEANINIELV